MMLALRVVALVLRDLLLLRALNVELPAPIPDVARSRAGAFLHVLYGEFSCPDSFETGRNVSRGAFAALERPHC
jgi:hypothetical protein